jgi:hypothetical protein
MDKRLGKYAHEKKDFVRPKEDLYGNPIADDQPLHQTRNIGGGYFVVIPLMSRDKDEINQKIAEISIPKTGKGKVINESIVDK